MTSSGTYDYLPAISNLSLGAFERCGLKGGELQSQHWASAVRESNLLQVEIGNVQPNLWTNELYSITLTEGTATYNIPPRMIAIQDCFIRTTSGGTTFDRVIFPLSTTEYDATPNKTIQAPPTAYFLNKLINPTITLWQVPDMDDTYTLYVRMLVQMQDSVIPSGVTPDMPYRFLDLFVAGLAYRLARIYAGDRMAMLKADYKEAWANAAGQDVQDGISVYVMPDFSGMWR